MDEINDYLMALRALRTAIERETSEGHLAEEYRRMLQTKMSPQLGSSHERIFAFKTNSVSRSVR